MTSHTGLAILLGMGLPENREQAHYTYRQYLTWPEGERYELIDGIAYAMSPAPRLEHQRVSGEIYAQIHSDLKEGPCRVFAAPTDVRLSAVHAAEKEDDEPTVIQPDLLVGCRNELFTERGVAGAPELIIEIVSPESGYSDRKRKFDLYERYGVREYWIVDPDERLVEVYLLESDNRFRRAGIYGSTDTVAATAVGGVAVDLQEVFPTRRTDAKEPR
jgi:Uma2 family endonuclease